MKIPTVALVGKPNVGKSTLFNRLAGKRISIIEDTPGVTRDRIYSLCEYMDYKFHLIDTGGIDLGNYFVGVSFAGGGTPTKDDTLFYTNETFTRL